MKYINHPRPPVRCLSGETLVRIADRLAGMLNLTAVDPVVIQATVITEGSTTEIVGEGGNEQIAWIRADSICYLRLRDFRLCYAYATREAVERDCQFAEHFRDCCHISLPDVITDAAREVLLEIGDADYWVAPAFRNMLTEEERRYASGCHVESLSKADATTGVELDGAKLTLLDASGKEIDSWTSVAGEPHLIEGLAIGATYTLREDIAPYGYLISNAVKFTVGDTAEIQKVVMKDEVPTGKIIINKSGEFLSDVSVFDSATGWIGNTFSFITGGLKDVTFGVYAYDDIKQADGVSPDYYAAGTQIGTITTDNTGVAIMENLPLGRYMVKEIATQDGYVLDDQPRLIDLTYRDSKTPVVTYSEAWQNERQRARVTVVKKERDGDRLLEGAVFGLYSAEDITGENGKAMLAKDTLIEQRATDSNGKLTFEVDLPVGFDYSIKEITPPAGFASDPNAQTFTFDGSNTDVAVVEMEYAFEDAPTVVEVTKSSLTTGKEIEGASLQVTDDDGNVIDSWTSGTEPHRIIGLVVGKTYTLTETLPASGYATAESIVFTISDTGDVQPVEMKDDVTKVKVSKTDLTGKKELEGAKLTILDSEGKVVETWTSTTEPHYIEMLPIDKYTLREETAPSGYLVAEEVEFEIKDTAEIQTVTMKDAEENPEQPGTPMPDTPKTGDMNSPLLWGGVGLVALLGLMTAVLMRKNRRKF